MTRTTNVLLFAVLLTGCADLLDPNSNAKVVESTPAAPERPDIFDATYRAAKAIEASQQVGISRDQFTPLLQTVATELAMAKDRIATDDERKIAQSYDEAIEIWKDSGTLWDLSISIPTMISNAIAFQRQFGGGKMQLITDLTKYRVALGGATFRCTSTLTRKHILLNMLHL